MSTPGQPTTDLDTLRADVRAFLRAEIAAGTFSPASDSWMTGFDPAFSAALAARGWVGMTIPTEYGGHGRTAVERFVVTEELLAHGAPVAAHWIADRQMAPSILVHGSDTQRRRHLPRIASGRSVFAIGMSEPDAGSDLASVRTRATESDGHWILSGTKVWTTGAHVANAMVLLARTDGRPEDRQQGLSQLLIELPHPDVEIRPLTSIDGQQHFNEVVFHDAAVPADALLGRRGDGWAQVMGELAFERSGPERYLSTMPLLRAWTDQLRHSGADAYEREVAGRLTARAWALRQMSLRVATELSTGSNPTGGTGSNPTGGTGSNPTGGTGSNPTGGTGSNPTVLAAMVKDLGAQFEVDVVEAIRASTTVGPRRDGGDAFARMLAQSLLHTPVFTLRGGTTEILRGIIARGLGLR
ncbi:acyl-CoA dehydrogenase family protein [Gordonia sp. ABSL1-1]|uniref:acyl-CoA dehydrogenase family protein n=1 Tax=Gordonia sp. ABSL1-1 TaxID=3053923 RepID=UPI0025730B2C|nr:acyl-CoA dehydrogenase family protein [Gordonia sp. ABSL1-1]MDL9936205.1 acyl-CoA dehydrogenase family protein [Gordonia sp. ABSL1-1]